MQLLDNLTHLQNKINLYLDLNPHYSACYNLEPLPDNSHDSMQDSFELTSENSSNYLNSPHHLTWDGPERLPGNSPYLEMQFPGAASLMGCDEVPGCYVDTQLIYTSTTADGLGFFYVE